MGYRKDRSEGRKKKKKTKAEMENVRRLRLKKTYLTSVKNFDIKRCRLRNSVSKEQQ